MNYKDVAVHKERKLQQQNQRLKDLLHNAICFMEETQQYYGTDEEVHNYILDYLCMEEKEYKDVMEK
jgi:hypothetical protein